MTEKILPSIPHVARTNAIVEPEVYEPVPDKPRYIRTARMKSVSEFGKELEAALKVYLKKHNITEEESGIDYFAQNRSEGQGNFVIPKNYWRAIAFAVEGSSEGHYVHAGILTDDRHYLNVLTVKTFGGFHPAHRIAAILDRIMGQING